jgi:hypothetical protein
MEQIWKAEELRCLLERLQICKFFTQIYHLLFYIFGLRRVQQHKNHEYYISQELLAEYLVLIICTHHTHVVK